MEDVGIFMTILSMLRPNGIHMYIYNGHLVHYVLIWYIVPHFGIMRREKSGNPDSDHGEL
jgi:hypothetical protein